jgi:biotin carboxyl carrier protein
VIYDVTIADKAYRVELVRSGSGWRCKLNGREFDLDAALVGDGRLSLLIDGKSYAVKQEQSGGENNIVVGRERFSAAVRDPRSLGSRGTRAGSEGGVKKITAPMPGKVVRVLAPAGKDVDAGQAVLVIEAMKMQNELKAPKKGKVSKLHVEQGAAVEAGQILAEIE